MNDSDIASLRTEFNAMDKDEDGHLSRSDVMALVGTTSILGLQHVKADLQAQGGEAVSRPTAKFLQQLDLLDKVGKNNSNKVAHRCAATASRAHPLFGLNCSRFLFATHSVVCVQDDSISWEPFLFSVAASFHSLAPRATLSNTPDQSDLHSLDKFKSVVAVESQSKDATTITPVAAIAADNANDKNE